MFSRVASCACVFVIIVLSARYSEHLLGTNPVAPQSEPIPYYIHDGNDTPGYDPGDRELAKLALAAWSRESGDRLQFVEASTEPVALLRVRWISAEGNLFGETQRIRVGEKLGSIVYVSSATDSLGEPLAMDADGRSMALPERRIGK